MNWLKNRRKDEWRDKHEVEHSGPNGGPIKTASAMLPSDPAEAAKVYQMLMSGN
jgi:hypothetical protein